VVIQLRLSVGILPAAHNAFKQNSTVFFFLGKTRPIDVGASFADLCGNALCYNKKGRDSANGQWAASAKRQAGAPGIRKIGSGMSGSARTFTFLGTGTSVGIPMVGCDCDVCTSTNPRNNRYRCSVLIGTPGGNILIDTGPELRLQLVREKVKLIHAVLYTHYHADHVFGIDDLRPFPRLLGGPVPLYCTAEVERKIRDAFSYAFQRDAEHLPIGYVPKLVFHRITQEPFAVLGERVIPIPLIHAQYDVFGFRLDDVAYCTDVGEIPRESWPLLQGLRVLVLDALRFKPHPAHFSLSEALAVIDQLKPKQAYLTHMSHEVEHEATNLRLPNGVALAYDGLRFDF
jgi:phosphoribosyl 1,2-cyclic phosphate phosphodiesterase